MAKRRRSTARTTTKIIRVAPARAAAPIIKVAVPRAVQTAKKYGRRAIAHVGSAAAAEKHTMWALGTAFIIGHMQKSGTKIPTFMGLSPEASVGLGAWAYGKWGDKSSRVAQHVATGALSIAVYKMGLGQPAFVEGDVLGGQYYPQQQQQYVYPGGAVVY